MFHSPHKFFCIIIIIIFHRCQTTSQPNGSESWLVKGEVKFAMLSSERFFMH
jgi:hypothetical protein